MCYLSLYYNIILPQVLTSKKYFLKSKHILNISAIAISLLHIQTAFDVASGLNYHSNLNRDQNIPASIHTIIHLNHDSWPLTEVPLILKYYILIET
jgi:hypothetical protein